MPRRVDGVDGVVGVVVVVTVVVVKSSKHFNWIICLPTPLTL